ncbi:hypothetical protein [Buchnera aphidicola]|uniref:hypothetical protein n=1 Tax=Buchnera aphidicola TaxID=9 RepID=UPI002093EE7A|nr:hypothetical protein [Buchnera aphidicola]USS94047.1 hypothetical protein M3Y47_01155 [Buchnera aphidicola (Sipha maydis)]
MIVLQTRYLNKKKKNKKICKKNFLSINQKNYSCLTKQECNVKNQKTQKFLINDIPQILNKKNIKKFLVKQKKNIVNKKKKINYLILDNKNKYMIQIKKLTQSIPQPLKMVEKKIIYLMKINQSKIISLKKLKKIKPKIQKKSSNMLNQKNIRFKQKKYILHQNKNFYLKRYTVKKIIKIKPIYMRITNYKNKWIILKIYKKFYTQLSNKKKYILYTTCTLYLKKIFLKLKLENENFF